MTIPRLVIEWGFYIMQASTLVPLAVLAWRWRRVAAPLRVLLWYLLLSVGCSLAGDYILWLISHGHPDLNTYGSNLLFNVGKVVVFGWMYGAFFQGAKRWVAGLLVSGLVLYGLGMWLGTNRAMALDVTQPVGLAILAALALLYVDEFLRNPHAGSLKRDPMALISIGHLVFVGGTIVAFSFSLIQNATTQNELIPRHLLNITFGLVFSYFLTLALLRAQPDATVPTTHSGPSEPRLAS